MLESAVPRGELQSWIVCRTTRGGEMNNFLLVRSGTNSLRATREFHRLTPPTDAVLRRRLTNFDNW